MYIAFVLNLTIEPWELLDTYHSYYNLITIALILIMLRVTLNLK